jgi:hypothetical protein
MAKGGGHTLGEPTRVLPAEIELREEADGGRCVDGGVDTDGEVARVSGQEKQRSGTHRAQAGVNERVLTGRRSPY